MGRFLALLAVTVLLIGAYSPDAVNTIDNNAKLQNIPSTAAPYVMRMGFAAPGDAPPLVFTASSSACSLNSGNGDGGSQVKSLDGKCWIADFTGTPDVRQWGANPAAADNTAALQAAVNARQGKTLLVTGGIYKFTSLSWTGALYLKSDETNAGRSSSRATSPNSACAYSGLRQLVTNQAILLKPGTGSTIDGLCIDAVGRFNNAGTMIDLTGVTNVTVRYAQINGACIGIDISTVGSNLSEGSFVEHVEIYPGDAAGCVGIRVGHQSTTIPGQPQTTEVKLSRLGIYCQTGTANTVGMLIEEVGGLWLSSNDIVSCGYGTVLKPGANQTIDGVNISNTVLGDSSTTTDLLIDTGAATGLVQHVFINNSWMASAVNAETVRIANTGGGGIAGIHFNRANIYPRGDVGAVLGHRGINILASAAGGTIKDISVDASTICVGATSSVDYIVAIAAPLRFAIRDSTIGGCDRAAGDYAVGGGLLLNSTNPPAGVITGNMFLGMPANKILTLAAGGAVPNMIVRNNSGLDDFAATLATATTLAMPANSLIMLTGSTPIQTLSGGWTGRSVTLEPQPGSTIPAFAGGGNLCNLVTPVGGAPVIATYSTAFACWVLK